MSTSATRPGLEYPVTATVGQVDDYHGTVVADPYRWLEDLDSPETAAWVERQNTLTFGYLERLPGRETLRQRLTELWDYERFSAPVRRGSRYFHTYNTGLQNQDVLFVSDDLRAEPRVLLDPNPLSGDGTIALTGAAVSHDGALLAYGLSAAGSDWQEWRVRDVATGADLDDHLVGVKFSEASWTPDGRGFYYSGYGLEAASRDLEDANYNHRVYYHRLGDPQAADALVYERPDHPDWLLFGKVTDDGRYLVVTAVRGTEPRNAVFVLDLQETGAQVRGLRTDFDAAWTFIDNLGPKFLFQTDLRAPNRRIVELDAATGAETRVLVPEGGDPLQGATLVGDRLLALYLHDVRTIVRRFDLDGTAEGEVELPGIGTVTGFDGRREDREVFFSFTSFTSPPATYRYDVETGDSTLFRAPRVDFEPDDYVTRQVFYSSKDGTRVPMFITHRKDLALDGSAPTYLYGYGGFNVSLTPAFSAANLAWMEQGGVFAVANIRGGGEYGEAWHEAAMRARRQNAFDDFIAAGEWLVASGIATPATLAIGGDSGGGLLVGACMTQRPDLFGAVRVGVGVLDLLRFHRFTIGWAWTSDFGDPDDPAEFAAIRAYSPLHNIRPGTAYPATLVTTADHDDRVVPSHSFKFTAALQAAQGGVAPILARIDVRAGHGMGKPTAKVIDTVADSWAFLLHELGKS